MAKRTFKNFVADFETTVYAGQKFTEVWLAAFCELYTENVQVQNSLDKFMCHIFSLRCNARVFFHNLKFDGSFILDWIKKQRGYHERLWIDERKNEHMEKDYHLRHKDYIYQISDKGVFYSITINYRGYLYVFYDSYKIVPFSVDAMAKAFGTKHKKLNITYEGKRKANAPYTEEERKYIANDVLVVKEVLEKMFDMGLNRQTIGSNALHQFKKDYDEDFLQAMFPNLYEIPLDKRIYGVDNMGEYIHKSYHGGWCYCDKRRKDQIQTDGCTVDANSLYPSRMYLERYPVGLPTFFTGEIPDIAKEDDKLFFVRIKCRFRLKKDFLPFIQIKGDLRYNGREMLESNQIKNKYGDILADDPVTFTMTQIDYYLFLEHYNTYDLEYLDGCYFKSMYHIFDKYIDTYMRMKIESKDLVHRTIAKLLLNNLYGKFAMYIDSSFKVAFLSDERIAFRTVSEYDKTPTYIPIGSYITAYARNTTIRLAQKNYDNFCYADTDSLHCICQPKDLVDIPIDEKKLGYWKVECSWKRAIFHRPKSYIESIIIDGKETYDIKCAGMGKEPKLMLKKALQYRDGSITKEEILALTNLEDTQKEWILQGADLSDFKTGLEIFGNLKARRIIGGIVLVKSPFVLRG